MPKTRLMSFDKLEIQIRKKDYAILGTIDSDGFPHSTSVLYGVSEPDDKFSIYVITGKSYKKAKNIGKCSKISVVIPFPHHILRFVPANCIQFQGEAIILPISDNSGIRAFQRNKVLRMTLDDALLNMGDYVFLKIIPKNRMFGYGIGMGIRELRDNHEEGSFRCVIPTERLE